MLQCFTQVIDSQYISLVRSSSDSHVVKMAVIQTWFRNIFRHSISFKVEVKVWPCLCWSDRSMVDADGTTSVRERAAKMSDLNSYSERNTVPKIVSKPCLYHRHFYHVTVTWRPIIVIKLTGDGCTSFWYMYVLCVNNIHQLEENVPRMNFLANLLYSTMLKDFIQLCSYVCFCECGLSTRASVCSCTCMIPEKYTWHWSYIHVLNNNLY